MTKNLLYFIVDPYVSLSYSVFTFCQGIRTKVGTFSQLSMAYAVWGKTLICGGLELGDSREQALHKEEKVQKDAMRSPCL